MIAYLYKLLIGNFSFCQHEWEKEREIQIVSSEMDQIPIRRKYVCRCKKCGEYKSFKL